jgi:hypothetical protein
MAAAPKGSKLKCGLAPTGVLRQKPVHSSSQSLNIRPDGEKRQTWWKRAAKDIEVLRVLTTISILRGTFFDMKTIVLIVGLSLLPVAVAQVKNEDQSRGLIYGVVVDASGKPARAITLVGSPQGVALSSVLPRTRSNESGEYRFENLPWWGRYRVYA